MVRVGVWVPASQDRCVGSVVLGDGSGMALLPHLFLLHRLLALVPLATAPLLLPLMGGAMTTGEGS